MFLDWPPVMTNSFFWKSSVFNKLLVKQDLELISPEYAIEEINKHSQEIMNKANLYTNEFKRLIRELAIRVEFIPLEEYASFLKQAKSIIEKMPTENHIELLNDADFIALTLKLNCPIWSNDKMLKNLPSINVFSTKEIILLLNPE